MRLIRGTDLRPEIQKRALAEFVHRNTVENRKQRAFLFEKGGIMESCTAPAVSDKEWLHNYAFYVNSDGSLDRQYSHCEPACIIETYPQFALS